VRARAGAESATASDAVMKRAIPSGSARAAQGSGAKEASGFRHLCSTRSRRSQLRVAGWAAIQEPQNANHPQRFRWPRTRCVSVDSKASSRLRSSPPAERLRGCGMF
jgi:hypothetical protein